MIIWLASYPRSGNTLLRTILKAAFGLSTYSLYDDREDIAAKADVAEATGHVVHGRDRAAFVREAAESPNLYLIKTHDPPASDSPTIYIVRDGRSASVSYWHYRRKIDRIDHSLHEVVAGKTWPGTWSAHVAAWRPESRPRTLLLRYESLRVFGPDTLRSIGDFLGREPTNARIPDFAALREMDPSFFRSGSDPDNIAELERTCPELFWLANAAEMRRMRYAGMFARRLFTPGRRRRLAVEIRDAFERIRRGTAADQSRET